jgi:hypothetical protein
MNPNPNPKDVGVLPRRHVGSAILDHLDGLREGHRATAHPPRVDSGRHKRAPPRDGSMAAYSPSGERRASASGFVGGTIAHRQQPRVVRPYLGLGHCRESARRLHAHLQVNVARRLAGQRAVPHLRPAGRRPPSLSLDRHTRAVARLGEERRGEMENDLGFLTFGRRAAVFFLRVSRSAVDRR